MADAGLAGRIPEDQLDFVGQWHAMNQGISRLFAELELLFETNIETTVSPVRIDPAQFKPASAVLPAACRECEYNHQQHGKAATG